MPPAVEDDELALGEWASLPARSEATPGHCPGTALLAPCNLMLCHSGPEVDSALPAGAATQAVSHGLTRRTGQQPSGTAAGAAAGGPTRIRLQLPGTKSAAVSVGEMSGPSFPVALLPTASVAWLLLFCCCCTYHPHVGWLQVVPPSINPCPNGARFTGGSGPAASVGPATSEGGAIEVEQPMQVGQVAGCGTQPHAF